MEGRFPEGLKITVEQNPETDVIYVHLSGMDDGWLRTSGQKFIEALRSRNYAEEASKRFSYWEICKTSQGLFLVWQAKKQKQLGNIKSNMATFFTHINLDPALADGIQFLDFKGLLLLGLFSSNAAGQPAPSVGENDSEEDELPERFRSKKEADNL